MSCMRSRAATSGPTEVAADLDLFTEEDEEEDRQLLEQCRNDSPPLEEAGVYILVLKPFRPFQKYNFSLPRNASATYGTFLVRRFLFAFYLLLPIPFSYPFSLASFFLFPLTFLSSYSLLLSIRLNDIG
jgi:hypothetical protein